MGKLFVLAMAIVIGAKASAIAIILFLVSRSVKKHELQEMKDLLEHENGEE